MGNYIGPVPDFSYQRCGFPGLSEDLSDDFEIPAIQDQVELVAQQAIQQLSGSNDNNSIDVRNLRFPEGKLFTREECFALVDAKLADKRPAEIFDMFPGRTYKQVGEYWRRIIILNPGLDEKVKLARAAPVEVEQVSPSVQAAVRNLRFPEGKLFTREQSIALVYTKIADKRAAQIAEMFPGRSSEQIQHYWTKLRLYNPGLDEIVKQAREAPVEVEQVVPAIEIYPQVPAPINQSGGANPDWGGPENFLLDFEIIQNGVEPVAQQASGSDDNNSIDVRNLRFPEGRLFTREESILLVNAKIADKRATAIFEMFPGRTSEQVHHCWNQIKKLNPGLDEKVKKRVREASVEIEQVSPSVQAAVRNLRFPKGKLFTLEESIRLVYAKIAEKRPAQIAKMFPGRSSEQIQQYWNKIRLYNPGLDEIIKLARGAPVEVEQVEPTMGIDQKRNTDMFDGTIQPAKRIKTNATSPSAELRLVFSVPLSLGEVHIKRPAGLKYTVEEDIAIINAEIAEKNFRVLAEGMPGQTYDKLAGRLRHLKATIPDLANIIRTARIERARLERMEPALLPEQESGIARRANLFVYKSISQLFSPEQDEEIFYSKVRGETEQQIAERLGKKHQQIAERWRYLLRTNPGLKSKFQEAKRELQSKHGRDRNLGNLPPLRNEPVQHVEPAVEVMPDQQFEPAVEFIPFEHEESALLFDQEAFKLPDL